MRGLAWESLQTSEYPQLFFCQRVPEIFLVPFGVKQTGWPSKLSVSVSSYLPQADSAWPSVDE